MSKSIKFIIKSISLCFIVVLIAACSSGIGEQPLTSPEPPTNTPVPPTSTPLPPTSTSTPTLTDTPTATSTASPTFTATATATDEPTATPTFTATAVPQAALPDSLIVKYLVQEGTGGPVGCGDSLVPVSVGVLRTGDVKEDVRIALDSLFSTGTKYSGLLYNPLFQSKLRVNDISFKKNSGNVTVHLTGSFTKPQEDCDKLLYRAQVWSTARQFPEVKLATIWLNQYLLGDLLVVGDN